MIVRALGRLTNIFEITFDVKRYRGSFKTLNMIIGSIKTTIQYYKKKHDDIYAQNQYFLLTLI